MTDDLLPDFAEMGIPAVRLLQGVLYEDDESTWDILLANESGTIIHRDPEPAFVGLVGPTAVPQTTVPDQNTSPFHLGRNRLDLLTSVFGTARVLVATRHDACGTVRFGKVTDRPHAVADDRCMRPRQRDHLIVGMDRLGCFARTNADRRNG